MFRPLLIVVVMCFAAASALAAEEDVFSAVATPMIDVTAPTERTLTVRPPSPNTDRTVGRSDSEQHDAIMFGRSGALMTYGEIRRRVKSNQPGDIVKVRLNKRDNRRWVYDVTVLSDKGQFLILSYNAHNGVLLSRKKR